MCLYCDGRATTTTVSVSLEDRGNNPYPLTSIGMSQYPCCREDNLVALSTADTEK